MVVKVTEVINLRNKEHAIHAALEQQILNQ